MISFRFFFSGLLHVPDEVNYLYIAEAILDGRITSDLHPHYEFFNIMYVSHYKDTTYSIYQIGYPLFLAPFVFLKVPFLLNPILNALSVFLIGRISEEFYGMKVAFTAMFLASFSLFTALLGGTLMAHSFCAAATLSAFYFAILSVKNQGKKRWIFVLISALCISFLMLARPQNALFVLIFILIYLFVFIDKKSFFKSVFLMGSLISVFFVILLYSNYSIIGKAGELKHSSYWNVSEPENDCMGLGIGKGCKFGTTYEMPDEGLTWSLAFRLTAERLRDFIVIFAFNPLFLLFLIASFISDAKSEDLKKDLMILGGFLIIFVAYFFYYHTGPGYGTRYYYEGSFFLFPLVAKGLLWIFEKQKKYAEYPFVRRNLLFSSFFVASFLFQYLFSVPYVKDFYSKGLLRGGFSLRNALEKSEINEGVVFITPEFLYGSGTVLMSMYNIDGNKLVFAYDFGVKHNQNLMNYYKGRKFYLAIFDFQQEDFTKIVELEPLNDEKEITIEMERKNYPIEGVPDYCNRFPQYPDFVNKYAGFSLEPDIFANKILFFCRFTEESQFYTFGQYFEKGGTYKVKLYLVKVPEGGRFKFSGKNFEKQLDFYSEEAYSDVVEFTADFEIGMNFLKISPIFEGTKEKMYFIIDKMEFLQISENEQDL